MLPALAALASSPTCGAGDPTLTYDTCLVVSAAITQMVAIQHSLPHEDLQIIVQFMSSVAGQQGCGQYLAALMWCLCRHEDNRCVQIGYEGLLWVAQYHVVGRRMQCPSRS